MKNNKDVESLAQEQRNAIDDYLGSIVGLYAFAESACWDEKNKDRINNSYYSIPHKFTDEDKELTPDSAIQVNPGYGLVAEMKKHFNESKPNQFEQIKKYDKNLKGWWTDNKEIEIHDLVLLCHMFSSVSAEDTYLEWTKNENGFERKFAIVEFAYTDSGQKQNFVLRRLSGQLSDFNHDEALRKTKIIPPKIVEKLFSKYKFYDAEPPTFHTTILIYNSILPLLVNQEVFEESTGRQKKVVNTDVDTVRKMLQEQFLPSDHYLTLPKLKWVIDALDFLVNIDLGVKIDEKNYTLIIQPPPRKDLCEYFSSKIITKKNLEKKKSPAQQDLFTKENNPTA